jgi:CheY-like chemotaxis protein
MNSSMNKASTAAPATPAPSRHAALKVLLVDDDAFQLKMITGIFQGLGVTDIAAASSGEAALMELSVRRKFDLMVLDLHMPGMDGFKFMEAVSKAGYTGALIIASGQSGEIIHSASLVAQLRRFTLLGSVTKPVSRAALSALLSKLP